MWLELVKDGFVTAGITKTETKFAHTIQLMQPDQLAFVSDALPSKNYETLKLAITKAFCPSVASQRRKFHSTVELRDRSPRELVVEIRSIGSDIGSTSADIRRRWLDALPLSQQPVEYFRWLPSMVVIFILVNQHGARSKIQGSPPDTARISNLQFD
ncbi:hypothetical protein BLOT_007566 [Blomia tropicalis]|nr:hypothetical protein BLOT_007566 [Blomia tropicalis]